MKTSASLSGGSRAVGRLEVAGGSVQADRDVVVLDARGGVDVDDGIDADGIGEVDLAALQLILRAGEGRAAVGDLDAAEQGGLGDGAAYVEIHAAGELGVGVLEVELRRAGDVDIQPNLVGGGVGIGRRGDPAAAGEGGKIDVRADAEAGESARSR